LRGGRIETAAPAMHVTERLLSPARSPLAAAALSCWQRSEPLAGAIVSLLFPLERSSRILRGCVALYSTGSLGRAPLTRARTTEQTMRRCFSPHRRIIHMKKIGSGLLALETSLVVSD